MIRTIKLHEIQTEAGHIVLVGGYSPDPEKQAEIDLLVSSMSADSGSETDKLLVLRIHDFVVQTKEPVQ